jgi:hypothetical protein
LFFFSKEFFKENYLIRCEVNFPRAPEAGVQESTYDLRLDGK